MSSGLFKNVTSKIFILIYIIYYYIYVFILVYIIISMYKKDLVLNNPQGLIWYKTQPNQNQI